jgi:hypothetical protein
MNYLGLAEKDLQGLEYRLRNTDNLLTIVNPFVTAPDTTAQDIPILDCAVALFGETSEQFIAVRRLCRKEGAGLNAKYPTVPPPQAQGRGRMPPGAPYQ